MSYNNQEDIPEEIWRNISSYLESPSSILYAMNENTKNDKNKLLLEIIVKELIVLEKQINYFKK